MKKAVQIVGLPLIGVKEGIECGIVSELIIDPATKKVCYLVVDSTKGCFGLKVLALDKVLGIGNDFITTLTLEDVKDLWSTKEAIKMSSSSKFMIGARVITKEGNIVGVVDEFSFDESNGDIEELSLKDDEQKIIGRQILAISADQVFIDFEAQENQVLEVHASTDAEPAQTSEFEDEQKNYLLGKVIVTDIIDDDGSTLVGAGTIVDEGIIQLITSRDRLIDLTLSVD